MHSAVEPLVPGVLPDPHHPHTHQYEEQLSLEHIQVSELYPKCALTSDSPEDEIPFPVLHGENVLYLGNTSDDGVIALSNYRLFVRFKDAFINVPLGMIESFEYRDIFFIYLYCKDAHTLRCTFATNDACLEWYRRLSLAVDMPNKLQDVFAFAFHAWLDSCRKSAAIVGGDAMNQCKHSPITDDLLTYSFGKEVERMGFDLKNTWRITYANDDFKLCSSYPTLHLVPACITDEDIRLAASFRGCHRFPSVVWRDQRSGTVLARCSQPEVGLFGWRNTQDENLLQAILAACAFNDGDTRPSTAMMAGETPVVQNGTGPGTPDEREDRSMKKLLILDARSYTAAVANRAKGGGCECPEYYANCEIQFMGLANIHAIRKSFQAMRTLCSSTPDQQQGWLSGMENSRWLHYISGLLRASLVAVNALDAERRPVLVHCSDGWDRTPQIVTLAQLILDPYYRTAQGFYVLVQREWLDYGHKFADRCGHGVCSTNSNERCPVFLQWLDCVHQLLKQFPAEFQFNEAFLVKLLQHVYSCLFGTFLCNTEKERQHETIREHTGSVWSLLLSDSHKFINRLYLPGPEQVLRPDYHIRSLQLWQAVYLSETVPSAMPDDSLIGQHSEGTLVGSDELQASRLPKTRSCDNLVTATATEPVTCGIGRRLSDPNITSDPKLLLAGTNAVLSSDDFTPDDSEPGTPDVARVDVAFSINGGVDRETLTNGNAHMNGDLENGATTYEAHENISRLQNGHSSANELVQRIGPLANGSTDTLTEEPNASGTSTVEHNGETPLTNGHTIVEFRCDISTSTSDISDSHALGGNSRLDEALMTLNVGRPHTLEHHHHHCCSSEGGSVEGGESTEPPQSTSTPTSTNPSTPADIKGCELWSSRTVNSTRLERYLDSDGLTVHVDAVQQRLAQIEAGYRSQIRHLHRQLHLAKNLLYHYTSGQNGAGKHLTAENGHVLCPDATTNGDDSATGSSSASGGGMSSAGDMSWEQVDERDANMTLWVPDHAVTHCAGCEQQFWIVRRKHHCRNCGLVFCGECTKFSMPVPQQQLNGLVRVCRKCFRAYRHDGTAPQCQPCVKVTNDGMENGIDVVNGVDEGVREGHCGVEEGADEMAHRLLTEAACDVQLE